jgi:hypothetical protein
MTKKAESTETLILMLFEILIVILVVWMAADRTMSYAKSETIFKINAANDLMMMVNAVVGTPGNSVVTYPVNISKFTLILDSGSILVMKKGDFEISKVIRKFNLPEGYSGEGVVEEKANVCLAKENKKIILKECPKLE